MDHDDAIARRTATVTPPWSTSVTRRLGIEVPVLQAPMGGGPSTVELAAAVSNAGGLGTLAGGYLAPGRLRDEIGRLREATSRPFAVNLFVPSAAEPDEGDVERMRRRLAPLRTEVGLAARGGGAPWAEDFGEQLAVVVEARVPVVTFAFGPLSAADLDRLRASGTVTVGTATNVAEARALADAGVDMVCAQGAEAGGHHGSWLAPAEESLIGTMVLVPLVCDAVTVPVLAAGGIMDGRGLAAALCLGAGAAQMGTAFLRCPEAGTAPAHRRAVAGASETDVDVTSKVTGRLARGVRNRLMTLLRDEAVPPYPVMHTLTGELRRAAATRDDPELMSLWSGQGAPLAGTRPAAEVVQTVASAAALLLAVDRRQDGASAAR